MNAKETIIEDMHGSWIDFDAQAVLRVRKLPIEVTAFEAKVRLRIHTKEGVMIAEPGDFVIKGIAGEYYPCDGNIFKQTYQQEI